VRIPNWVRRTHAEDTKGAKRECFLGRQSLILENLGDLSDLGVRFPARVRRAHAKGAKDAKAGDFFGGGLMRAGVVSG